MSIPWVSAGTDWSLLSIWGKYWNGFYRRAQATNTYFPAATPVIGTDLQFYLFYLDMQQWVVNNYNKFVDTRNYPLNAALSTPPPNYTLQTFCAAADLYYDGTASHMFQRSYPGGNSHGYMQAGDYITKEIFQDLYRALFAMDCVQISSSNISWQPEASYVAAGSTFYAYQWGRGSYAGNDADTTKLSANAVHGAWHQLAYYTSGGYGATFDANSTNTERPRHTCIIERELEAPGVNDWNEYYETEAHCQKSLKFTYSNWPAVNATLNFYVFTEAPETPTYPNGGVGQSAYSVIDEEYNLGRIPPQQNTWTRWEQRSDGISGTGEKVTFYGLFPLIGGNPRQYSDANAWPTPPAWPSVGPISDDVMNGSITGWRVTYEKVYVQITDWNETY